MNEDKECGPIVMVVELTEAQLDTLRSIKDVIEHILATAKDKFDYIAESN